jgi:hypothetical protein
MASIPNIAALQTLASTFFCNQALQNLLNTNYCEPSLTQKTKGNLRHFAPQIALCFLIFLNKRELMRFMI